MTVNTNLNSNLLQFKDLNVLWSYKKLVHQADDPIPFKVYSDDLWRHSGIRYGSFFDKRLCNHVVFFSMGLKKNIGLPMPFLLNFKSKPKSILRFDYWPRHSFVYIDSLIHKASWLNLSSEHSIGNIEALSSFMEEKNQKFIFPYRFITRKRLHRVLNTWDIDVNSSISNYNAEWAGGRKIETSKAHFFLDHLPIISSRSGYSNSSFFINFTDPRKALYPEKFFQHKTSSEGILKHLNLSKYFKSHKKNYYFKLFYNKFYENLLCYFFKLFNNRVLNKLNLYYNAIKAGEAMLNNFACILSCSFLGHLDKTLLYLGTTEPSNQSTYFYETLKEEFLYRPSNISNKNLIFKFFFYNSWVAKKFFRVTHWFNLNAYSVKKKSTKYDFRFMGGFKHKKLGKLKHWYFRFMDPKDKKQLFSSITYLRLLKKCKKKAIILKRLKKKIYFANRYFLKKKKRIGKPAYEKLEFLNAHNKKVKRHLMSIKKKLGASWINSIAVVQMQRKKINNIKKKISFLEKKVTDIIVNKLAFKKKFSDLNKKALKIKVQSKNAQSKTALLEGFLENYKIFKNDEYTNKAKRLGFLIRNKMFSLKKKRSKVIKRYLAMHSALGYHRYWDAARNLDNVHYYKKWKGFNNKRIFFFKKRLTFITLKMFEFMRSFNMRKKIYKNVILSKILHKNKIISNKRKNKLKIYCVKKQMLWLKKKMKPLAAFKRLARKHIIHLQKPKGLNKKNIKRLADFTGYLAWNASLYSKLIKKAKLRRNKNYKLYRNLKTGLIFWRGKRALFEGLKRKFLKALRKLYFIRARSKFIPYYVKLSKKFFFKKIGLTLQKKNTLNKFSKFQASNIKFKAPKVKFIIKSKQEHIKNLGLIDLKKKKATKHALKLSLLKQHNLNIKKTRNFLIKKPIRVLKSLARKKRFKLINLATKIKLKLIKIRRIFLLTILQNLKNKFWISLSILSKSNSFTYDMLIFLKKYIMLKRLILKNSVPYKKIYKRIN